jgi:hypothetical protein
MHVHAFSVQAPTLTGVLEIADQLFFPIGAKLTYKNLKN